MFKDYIGNSSGSYIYKYLFIYCIYVAEAYLEVQGCHNQAITVVISHL